VVAVSLKNAIIMYRFGLSLNLMSLGGLALAVGMVVDSGIVVLESIFRKKEEGEDTIRAASSGAGTVAKAVTASTLTTVAVFLPLVFVEGLAGQLIKDQALTISFSLLAALAVSVTLVPTIWAFGSRQRYTHASENGDRTPIRPPTRKLGRFFHRIFRWTIFGVLFLPRLVFRLLGWLGKRSSPLVDKALVPFDSAYGLVADRYPKILGWALAHRGRVLTYSAGALVVTMGIAVLMPSNLFPTFTQGEFYFNVRMPEGTALHVTDAALDELASMVKDDPRVRFVYTSSGQTDLSEFAGGLKEPNRGQISVVMRNVSDRKAERAVAERLRRALGGLPGVSYEFDRPALLTFKSPVEVEIYTYDLDTLRTVSDAVAARLSDIDGIDDVEASIRLGDPEVQISFDRARLAAMDLDPAEASRLVRNAVQGEAATQFDDLERKLDVRVRASEDQRSVVANLANLQVGRSGEQPVRLGAVADVQVRRGPSEIRRISQQRAAVVSANLKGRDLGSASDDIEARLLDMDLPPGTRVSLAGQNRELTESFASLRFALLLAIFLVYLVMASQFESLLHPFVVMFSLPLALVGVVITLLVTGTALSVMVLIGLVVLAGIVVNNAIVLVDYTNQLRQRGLSKIDALMEAGKVRLRPILMTTMTTILGLLPLTIGMGEGIELRAPLALTLIGGLLFATVLTLVVIPVVYATLDRSS
jgi:HAE1 family hydrophobic/amphiphilic exporter-1